MSTNADVPMIAVLDDYQNVALSLADWPVLKGRADVTVFNDFIGNPEKVIQRLRPFEVVCVMRERTLLPRAIISQLPKLRLIVSAGPGNASIDKEAAAERGIEISNTGYNPNPAIELSWALILASARHIVAENLSVSNGGWQTHVGMDLYGKTLGVVGLGHIGARVAEIGKAFGMNVIAWSQNLTAEKAADVGAERVSKEELLRRADIVSIHLVLSGRTRGLVSAQDIALMKPTAFLVNASRGPIVVEADLIEALKNGRIAGAALDVFDREPLDENHPFRTLSNVLTTPHIGYVTEGLYRTFYGDTVKAIRNWLDRHP